MHHRPINVWCVVDNATVTYYVSGTGIDNAAATAHIQKPVSWLQL